MGGSGVRLRGSGGVPPDDERRRMNMPKVPLKVPPCASESRRVTASISSGPCTSRFTSCGLLISDFIEVLPLLSKPCYFQDYDVYIPAQSMSQLSSGSEGCSQKICAAVARMLHR